MKAHIKAKTLDDLLRQVLEQLLESTNIIEPSKGKAFEETGILLELSNPRARLSSTEMKGKPFSCLGEFLWYLSGTDDPDFIVYYIPFYKEDDLIEDDGSIHGAYGPRLFNMRMKGIDQIENVLQILKNKPDSRQAVIQLFDASDIDKKYKDIPCTCTLQFMLRRNKLHMLANMRSNDAFKGLPHDFFAFTMIQEMFARYLSVELGTYKHAVGSLHLYLDDQEKALKYLKEGLQQTTFQMPKMPKGDAKPSIKKLLKIEAAIRKGEEIDISGLQLAPYWADLAYLIEFFSHFKSGDHELMSSIKEKINSDVYILYLEQKQASRKEKTQQPEQLDLIKKH